MVKESFPVNSAQVRDIEDTGKLIGYLDKGNVLKTQCAVGDDALKLVAETFYIVAGFDKVTAPIQGGGWVFDHQHSILNELWDDSLTDDIVDSCVVFVLLLTVPKVHVGECLAVEILGGEDSCTGNLGCLVAVVNLLKVLIVQGFHRCLGRKGFTHGGNGLIVHIDTIVLCPDSHRDCQGCNTNQYGYNYFHFVLWSSRKKQSSFFIFSTSAWFT